METTNSETGCCPNSIPSLLITRFLNGTKKTFVKGSVKTFFFMPINFGKVMTKMVTQIEASGATMPDGMGLSDHTSRWNMDIYVAVDKEIAGMDNVSLTGKFLSRVYEGNYNQTGKWCEDFKQLAGHRGLTIKKWYMWYNYCPKCAKHYGKNYVTIICEVESH